MSKRITFWASDSFYKALKSFCDDELYDSVGYGTFILVASSLIDLGYLPCPELSTKEDEL